MTPREIIQQTIIDCRALGTYQIAGQIEHNLDKAGFWPAPNEATDEMIFAAIKKRGPRAQFAAMRDAYVKGANDG